MRRGIRLTQRIHTKVFLYFEGKRSGRKVQNWKIAFFQARILYKSSSFMLLNEPTAALDPIAEYNAYQNFNTLIGDNPAVYVSHRLSSTRFCDEIVYRKAAGS